MIYERKSPGLGMAKTMWRSDEIAQCFAARPVRALKGDAEPAEAVA
jgi:hypothetical protein